LQTNEQAARIWFHEILRVFSDRLINEDDRLYLFQIAKNAVNRIWQLNFDKIF
jgi:dynein heavy chain